MKKVNMLFLHSFPPWFVSLIFLEVFSLFCLFTCFKKSFCHWRVFFFFGLFFSFSWLCTCDKRNLSFPTRVKPVPLRRKHGVLTTGLPGTSLCQAFNLVCLLIYMILSTGINIFVSHLLWKFYPMSFIYIIVAI